MSETPVPPPAEGGAATPPSLPTVEEGIALAAPPPPARPFPVRWAVAGIATVGLAGLAIAAWLLFGQPRADTVAGAWLPSDTVGYLEVSADLTPGQRDLVLGLLKRFPGFEDQARIGDKIDETLQRILDRVAIDYRAEVKPWLGDGVAFAFRAPGAPEGVPTSRDTATAPVALLVASTDDAAAARFVDALVQRAEAEGAFAQTEQYREVRITRLRPVRTDLARAPALAVVDGRLVAGEADLVRAVIDVRRGGAVSLASRDPFRAAIAALPGDRVGALWVDAEGAMAAVRRELGADGLGGPALGLLRFEPGSGLVGFARAEDDGLLFELRGRGSVSGTALLAPTSDAATPRASRLAATAPVEAAIFVDVHDVGAAIRAALAAARLGDPSTEETLRQVDQALAALGTSVDEIGGSVGDAGLVATVGGRPRVAVVLEITDPALASRLVSQVDALLGLSGLARVTTRDYQGIVLHRLETTSVTLPDANAAPTYALAGDALIVGFDEDIVISVIDARTSGRGLDGDPDYQAVIEHVGAENNGAAFVDLGELVRAFAGEAFDAEVRALAEPLRAMGWAGRAPGEDEWLGTSRFFLLVR